MPRKTIFITKASGEIAPFSEAKLRQSLERAGADLAVRDRIVSEIEKLLFDGMSTKEIYGKAFSILRKHSRPVAGRYKIKQAILELGPSGYPFEKFVGELLKHQGYQTKVGVVIQGYCVSHEIDVEAEKDNKHFMVECKFHNRQGYKCDVKIPLYINSRFEDVKKQWEKRKNHKNKFHEGWVVTNTRFTEDAMQYGKCSGLKLIGWDYPKQGSLSDRINVSGLHPITCLTTLTKPEKKMLIDNMVVLCKELCENPELLTEIGISESRIKRVSKEAKEICTEINNIA
ncbi:ATP cone domain-containing protein [Algoriphagus ratkowskyi]|uniref:ATP cone domain-containing protein n=1 Tax=Algoriphagus ratkowskyi TaxID=57028 RepID=A0A2W7QSI0_9BACT|nr:restriction endonuclease [Algoriphagus ratkowskyi]PZX51533.1 ATP cone domain-containing protein [Algoriphagus ratkowskyi]TXD78815.1 ATPase [Algoriphagus ratkowskyi]